MRSSSTHGSGRSLTKRDVEELLEVLTRVDTWPLVEQRQPTIDAVHRALELVLGVQGDWESCVQRAAQVSGWRSQRAAALIDAASTDDPDGLDRSLRELWDLSAELIEQRTIVRADIDAEEATSSPGTTTTRDISYSK